MEKKELLKGMGQLGFPVLETEEDVDANETITGVIKSGNTRLWEGFPVIFANINKNHRYNPQAVKKALDKKEYAVFRDLVAMSVALYRFLKLKSPWLDTLRGESGAGDEKRIKELARGFDTDSEIRISNRQLDTQRIRKAFDSYFTQESADIDKVGRIRNELSLEYALSQIFTVRQKEIFLKRLQGRKLTKTEREYFYRVVKKKALALANPDLQRLAEQVIR
ncbi:MAG: hypothetical protein JW976_00255 [Syntrophaceae bacterium]|nr:hypothetical protein [Syntrophaceae bacterium]